MSVQNQIYDLEKKGKVVDSDGQHLQESSNRKKIAIAENEDGILKSFLTAGRGVDQHGEVTEHAEVETQSISESRYERIRQQAEREMKQEKEAERRGYDGCEDDNELMDFYRNRKPRV